MAHPGLRGRAAPVAKRIQQGALDIAARLCTSWIRGCSIGPCSNQLKGNSYMMSNLMKGTTKDQSWSVPLPFQMQPGLKSDGELPQRSLVLPCRQDQPPPSFTMTCSANLPVSGEVYVFRCRRVALLHQREDGQELGETKISLSAVRTRTASLFYSNHSNSDQN